MEHFIPSVAKKMNKIETLKKVASTSSELIAVPNSKLGKGINDLSNRKDGLGKFPRPLKPSSVFTKKIIQ